MWQWAVKTAPVLWQSRTVPRWAPSSTVPAADPGPAPRQARGMLGSLCWRVGMQCRGAMGPVPVCARLPCCTQPAPSTDDNPGQCEGSAATEGAAEAGLGRGAGVRCGAQARVVPQAVSVHPLPFSGGERGAEGALQVGCGTGLRACSRARPPCCCPGHTLLPGWGRLVS